MYFRFVVAIGAGCAAALLFAVSAETSPLAMALAAATSVIALGLLAEPLSALLFAASVAVPAWAVAAFAAAPIGRYFPPWRSGAGARASVGSIVVLAAAIGMLGAAGVLTAVIMIYGGYGEGAKKVAAAVAALAADAFEGGADSEAAREFADGLVRFGPAAIAASTLLMLCVNLYAAARSTQLSHRLTRAWPDLPTSLSLPWALGVLMIACAAGAYALPAPASQYASVVAGGLGGAFVLQGLAVVHALSRGVGVLRPLMLFLLYVCCMVRAQYTLPVVAALGLIDAFVRLRTRPAFLPTPKPTTHK